ncbi:MAG: GNAT family N-acetyltransferase [Fimbriimonadales bacterium]
MTELGPWFLREYYLTVLNYTPSIFLVAEAHAERLGGFVAGFLHPDRFYQQLKARQKVLAISAGRYLLFRPGCWRAVLASVRRVHRLADDSSGAVQTAELASIGVCPQFQGQGIGKALVLAFIEQARRLEAHRVTLATDAEKNDSVNLFYQRLGFQLQCQYRHTPTRLMNLYEYTIEHQRPEVVQEP